MRTFNIQQITESNGVSVKGTVVVLGDQRASFQGKFYREKLPPYSTLDFYSSSTTPVGYDFIKATTFEIANNGTYGGRYTVYTSISAGDTTVPSSFDGVSTTITVNEIVSGLQVGSTDNIGTGIIQNISTYIIDAVGESAIVIPPGTSVPGRPIELFGRNSTPWGESLVQDLLRLAQSFAGPTAPVDPFVGQFWFNTTTDEMYVCNNSKVFVFAASGSGGGARVLQIQQTTPSLTWSITHNLNLPSPFLCLVQIFKDTGSGVQVILPAGLTFDTADSLTVSFSNLETGYVLISVPSTYL
jgi:hypothetical protein